MWHSAWASIRRPPATRRCRVSKVAGEIVATGGNVTRWRPGNKVCALVNGGGYAEYCLAEEPIALPIPAGLDMIKAAAVPETFFTVWNNVFERGRLAAGEWLLVHGGSSGIGTTAIQLAQGLRRQGHRDRRLRRQVQGLPRARRRPCRQLQDGRLRRRREGRHRRQGRRRHARHGRRRLHGAQHHRRRRGRPHRADRHARRRRGQDQHRPPDDEARHADGLDAPAPHARGEGRLRPRPRGEGVADCWQPAR